MTETLTFSCDCGKMQWALQNATRRQATRLTCYCRDCQAFANHLGHMKTLTQHGGTELNQCNPADVTFQVGAEHLALLRLSDKGIYRWFAGCCNTPVANTAPSAGVPFASLLLACSDTDVDSKLGPNTAHVNITGAYGADAPQKTTGLARVILQFIARAVRCRLNGDWRKSPFFQTNGKPVCPATVLTAQERATATPDAT